MNKKIIIIGILTILIAGTFTYFYIKKKKKVTENKKNIDSVDNEKPSLVDENSRAIKITEKKLNSLKELLSNYELKNNKMFDIKTGGEISVNARWSVWGLLNIQYIGLINGINEEKSISNATKEYANNVMKQYKLELEKFFPPSVFNSKSELFKKYKLDKMGESNVYNEKI